MLKRIEDIVPGTLTTKEALAQAREWPMGKRLPKGWGRLSSRGGPPGKIVPYTDSGLGDRRIDYPTVGRR